MSRILPTDRKAVPTLPVALLIEGRPVLVVGGGTVAFRRVKGLLEAGARVRVVAPSLSPPLEALCKTHRVLWDARPFHPSDVAECAVVYAATDHEATNQEVLKSCRVHRVLCGCADRGWQSGDLISPALTRHDEITVAVSSGGADVRRSKLIRDALARYLEGISKAEWMVLGVSHRTISLEAFDHVRSHLASPTVRGGRLRRWSGLYEFLLLDTCFRSELWAVGVPGDDFFGFARWAMGLDSLPPECWYHYHGEEALTYSAVVAAGGDSLLVGESAVTGQVRKALVYAEQQKWSGTLLRDWVSATLLLSRQIRARLPGWPPEEIEARLLRLLQADMPDLTEREGSVVGTGTLGTGVVEALYRHGCRRLVWLYHQAMPSLPAEWKRHVVLESLAALPGVLTSTDYLITASGGREPLIRRAHGELLKNRERSLRLVDLGMPRNVDHRLVQEVPCLRLWTLHDLIGGAERISPDTVYQISRDLLHANRSLYERRLAPFSGRNSLQ